MERRIHRIAFLGTIQRHPRYAALSTVNQNRLITAGLNFRTFRHCFSSKMILLSTRSPCRFKELRCSRPHGTIRCETDREGAPKQYQAEIAEAMPRPRRSRHSIILELAPSSLSDRSTSLVTCHCGLRHDVHDVVDVRSPVNSYTSAAPETDANPRSIARSKDQPCQQLTRRAHPGRSGVVARSTMLGRSRSVGWQRWQSEITYEDALSRTAILSK